jgi:predicted N-formylglutamate amidohydrolase
MTGAAAPHAPCRPAFLGADDPPPVEVVNADGRAGAVLVCDHASWAVPAALAGLGLDELVLKRHIGWDIGAADVTWRLAALLDAPAVLAGFSRLVIDCNRPLGTPASIPRLSDGVEIPGNRDVGEADARVRAEACFRPYHEAVDDAIARLGERLGGAPGVIAMHSFTPLLDGFERRWQVGILWDRDGRIAKPLLAALGADPEVCVGDNEPYSGRAPVPCTIPTHAVARGLPHVTIEMRQDLIDTHKGAEAWAKRLAAALGGVLAEPGFHRPFEG